MIFAGKATTGEVICSELAKQCSAKPIQIKIQRNQLHKKFDLAPASLKLRQKVKTISDDFAGVANLMRKVITLAIIEV